MEIDYHEHLRRIAKEMDQTHISSTASINYDLLADSLVWSDEYPAGIAGHCGDFDCVKLLLRYRTTVILGSPDDYLKPYWDRAKILFPNWGGFHPERLNGTEELRKFYEYHNKRGLRYLELCDKYCSPGPEKGVRPEKGARNLLD